MGSRTDLPTGDNITFLFTDIEGSTTLLRALGDDRYRAALEDHARIIRDAVTPHGGVEIATEGDAFFVVFTDARAALTAVVEAQQGLTAHDWAEDVAIRVRMGLHTGKGIIGGDNYMGLDVHKAARIASAGHGGQVLVSERTFQLVGEALQGEVKLLSLGEHRLKDFPRDERIFQLSIPGQPSAFPPLRAIGRNNLPAQLTSFIGREAELDHVQKLLGESRLVTLTGPGGAGKTRFAIETAARVRYDFLDGCFFVPLAPIADPELVPTVIADALDLKVDPGLPVLDAVKAHLAIKHILLVLDNFEHVLPATKAVSDLLRATTRLKVMATSREPLHVGGEQEFPVPPLATPTGQGASTVEDMAESEAVRLFVERARALRPGFALRPENTATVAAITGRLDGLPLAIELAAARIKVLSPESILERLDSSLSLLKTVSSDVPARQQTLRATIAWSYDLLAGAEQALLRRLAIFVNGFSLAAAEAVVGEDLAIDVLDGVGSLVDKSLMQRHEDTGGEERINMLDTIREFALEQLREGGELDELAARHLSYFSKLAKKATPQLTGDAQPMWIDRLDHEQDNFRSALTWATAHDVQSGLRLAGAMWRFWQLRGRMGEGRARLERLLALTGAATSTPARAEALEGLAGMFYWTGDHARARDLYEEALEIWRDAGDEERQLGALKSVADTFLSGGDAAAALPYYQQTLAIATGRGDEQQVAYSLRSAGMAMAMTGDLDGARDFIERAIDIFTQRGDGYQAAYSSGGGGFALGVAGDLDAARPYLERAMAFAEQSGIKYLEVVGHYELGWLATRNGDFEDAHDHIVKMIAGAEELGDQTSVALALNAEADLAIEAGQPERALRLAGAADAIRQRAGGGASPESMHARDPRQHLGDSISHADAEMAWREGAAMTYAAAVEFARRRESAASERG